MFINFISHIFWSSEKDTITLICSPTATESINWVVTCHSLKIQCRLNTVTVQHYMENSLYVTLSVSLFCLDVYMYWNNAHVLSRNSFCYDLYPYWIMVIIFYTWSVIYHIFLKENTDNYRKNTSITVYMCVHMYIY